MTIAVYPGSFDPPTLGHLDVVRRASGLFDEVVVAVLVNPDKRGLFAVEERLDFLREGTADWPGVTVDSFAGLLVDYCTDRNIGAIVKGLRAVSDFDYELQMAHMNRSLTRVETVFLPAATEFSFVSSSLVKQVASYGGDITPYVPERVADALVDRLGRTST